MNRMTIVLVLLTLAAGCGRNTPQDEAQQSARVPAPSAEAVVSVVILDFPIKGDHHSYAEKLLAVTDKGSHSRISWEPDYENYNPSSGYYKTTAKLSPVKKVDDFAGRIPFGNVVSVEGRTVTVRLKNEGPANKTIDSDKE